MKLFRFITLLAFSVVTGALAVAQDESSGADKAAALGRMVLIERIDNDVLCTVVVEDEGVRHVLRELAEQLSVDLLGFEGVQRTALVTADLRRRPVRQVLEFMLGSVGLQAQLRSDTLTVVEDTPVATKRGELLQVASASFLRAQALFPGHELAAGARISQGLIEEERSNWSGAIEHYQIVAENYATTPHLAEGLYRAGLMNERLSQWSGASLLFRQLINLEVDHKFKAAGRTELARCAIRMQDHTTALHLLKILADHYPPANIAEARLRDMLGAEALIGAGELIDALQKLERLESSGLGLEDRLAVHALRATAFESLEMTSEAGRAWLIYAHDARGPQRDRAIEKAVRLAAADDDQLSVLFVLAQANDPELERRLAPFGRDARAKLGLPSSFVPDELTVAERLAAAEAGLVAGGVDAAKSAVAPLLVDRRELTADERLRFALAWASILEQVRGLDASIAFLADERDELDELSSRSRLDIHAAELFEKHEQYEQAIEAYEGRYP